MHKFALGDYPNALPDFSLPPVRAVKIDAMRRRFCGIITKHNLNSASHFRLRLS